MFCVNTCFNPKILRKCFSRTVGILINSLDHERHAVDIARNLKLDKYDAIAVISGDGLILEVISGFLSRLDRERALKMPIAHIPGGTSNGLAASICFQCK